MEILEFYSMIDEFQDTDPQQYRIFRRIWHHQPETALLLIGDPKQAIYAFRGADIFTYMKARSEVHAHYTLDTNWRSAPGMVNSVNKLFSQTDDAFMFREIPFIPVKSAGKNQALRFVFKGETQPAMKMWLMEGESCGVGDYQSTMAQVCAAQIRDWLQAGQRGEALLMNGDDARPVRASDISVLVRSRQEAAQVRDALTLLEIPSVYLSRVEFYSNINCIFPDKLSSIHKTVHISCILAVKAAILRALYYKLRKHLL